MRVGPHAGCVHAVLAADLAELGLDADTRGWQRSTTARVTVRLVASSSLDPSNITEVNPSATASSTRASLSAWSRCSTQRADDRSAMVRVANAIGASEPW